MIEVKDRVPTYPGRMKLSRADGTVEYVTMERADAPTEEGTPINKALFDSIKADMGLAEDVTVYVSTAGSDATGDGTAAAPFSTIQHALNSIPKNLNGHIVNINIAAGTYPEDVIVENFSAARIVFVGAADAAVTINKLDIRNCTLNFEFVHITVSGGGIYGMFGAKFYLGPNTKLTCNGGSYGVYARYNCTFSLMGDVTINNTSGQAIRAGSACHVYVHNLSGTGNKVGLYAGGGIIQCGTKTLAATTEYTTSAGGRIYANGQSETDKY